MDGKKVAEMRADNTWKSLESEWRWWMTFILESDEMGACGIK